MSRGATHGDNPFSEQTYLSCFKNEEGYTSLSLLLALLLSLTLIFSAAAGQWVASRSADVQAVADAGSLSATKVVGNYTVAAQVLDACILSMGVVGVLVMGCGFVVSCIPGGSGLGTKMVDLSSKILDARRKFSNSVQKGLEAIEEVLPALSSAASIRCIKANSTAAIEYSGIAVSFPIESQSKFSYDEEEIDSAQLSADANELQKTSDEMKKAQDEADGAKMKGWLADCGNTPYCMWERASHLASLSDQDNPYYDSWENWSFAAPILRARPYYNARKNNEVAATDDPEDITRSYVRYYFYTYAKQQVADAYFSEEDGWVDQYFPELPRNVEQMKLTTLYTDVNWYLSDEDEGSCLHSHKGCPGIEGEVESVSLAEAERRGYKACPTCNMSVSKMGNCASASTSVDNGFEHWWREVGRAAKDYKKASDELYKAQEDLDKAAEKASFSFKEALDQLGVTRPKICPPGAWGCIAVVTQNSQAQVPPSLTAGFLSGKTLPYTIAISGSALAFDSRVEEENVLGAFSKDLCSQMIVGGIVSGVCDAWGKCLVAYGDGFEYLGGISDSLFSGLEKVGAHKTASFLRGKLQEIVEDSGLKPAEMRVRKPVLVNTQKILDKTGYTQSKWIKQWIENLEIDDLKEMSLSQAVSSLKPFLEDKKIKIAELSIPGFEIQIPIYLDLGAMIA